MKKFISLVLSLTMILSLFAGVNLTAYAETLSGTCGDNATWSLNTDTGELVISGTGDMFAYNYAPWYSQRTCIKKIVIENSITGIGFAAFASCNNLTAVSIPNSVHDIGAYAFAGCSELTNITLPHGVTNIGDSAFEGCAKLPTVNLPGSVTDIGNYAFEGCTQLAKIVIPNQIKSIGYHAFDSCSNLKEITIPCTVNLIISEASIEKITITKGSADGIMPDYYLNNLSEAARSSCTEIILEDGINNIGKGAFKGMPFLRKITIPRSVETIGTYAFCDCTRLSEITILNEKCLINDSAPGESPTIPAYTTIICYEGSDAQRYAKVHGNIFKSAGQAPYPKTFTLSSASFTCDGKIKTPAVVVKDNNGKVMSSTNYTVSYANGRKSVGKYAVKITMKGYYSGSKTLYFTICPKGTKINRLQAGRGKITVRWKKQKRQTTGYQLQYSKSKRFKGAKFTDVKKNKTVSKKISKLKRKTKYYVRIRTYKTFGKTKIYSAWSGKKVIKTK